MNEATDVLDNTNWHFFQEFPEELPYENAATHIAFIFGWAVRHSLESETIAQNFSRPLQLFRLRLLNCVPLLLVICDGRLLVGDLNKEAGEFAIRYIDSKERNEDLESILEPDTPTYYHIRNTWQNFDRYELLVNTRFDNWQKSGHTDMSLEGLDLSPLDSIDYENEFHLDVNLKTSVACTRYEFLVENKEFVIVRSIKWSTESGNPNFSDTKKLEKLEEQLYRYKANVDEGKTLTLNTGRPQNPIILARLNVMANKVGCKIVFH